MQIEVNAQKRTKQGTGASRRLRREGKTPGIVYGGKQPAVVIELDHNALYHQLREDARKCRKIRVLSVVDLLAETILRISNEDSVSSLFSE